MRKGGGIARGRTEDHRIKSPLLCHLSYDPMRKKWGDRPGSNRRHPGSQPGALPAELRPPLKTGWVRRKRRTGLADWQGRQGSNLRWRSQSPLPCRLATPLWRVGWDSNPRAACATSAFETDPLSRSGTHPGEHGRGGRDRTCDGGVKDRCLAAWRLPLFLVFRCWSPRSGSNRRPARYECAALPTEPHGREMEARAGIEPA